VLVVPVDTEYGGLIVAGVVVGTAEMLPVVLLLAVFVATAREVEAQPCLDLVGLAFVLVAVLRGVTVSPRWSFSSGGDA
jgi:hypothetical protein